MNYETKACGTAGVYLGSASTDGPQPPRMRRFLSNLEDTRSFSDEIARRIENLADRVLGSGLIGGESASKDAPASASLIGEAEDIRGSISSKLQRIHLALNRLESDLG